MDREAMNPEENYCFDVGGYLVVRGVLTPEEVRACNEGLDRAGESRGMLNWPAPQRDPFVRLRDHPVLAGYLDQLTYEGAELDREPWLFEETGSGPGSLLRGRDHTGDRRRAYSYQNGARFCQGLLAIWALTDVHPGDGGFVFVPASHKSGAETPRDLLTGADDMGLVRGPDLKAGDLLLCAETLLHGARPWKTGQPRRLLAYGYGGKRAQPPAKAEETPMDWIDELAPEERAVVRPDGLSGSPSVLRSDGERCWLEEVSGVFHPSIYVRDPDCGIDEREFYTWDLCGHVVLRNVMDADWLAAANTAIDRCSDRIKVGGSADKGSKVLAGTGVPSLHGLFELPKPYCDPFRRMLANPAVVHRLTWMMGSGFVWRNARAICSVKGTSGHGLHSGGEPARPASRYTLHNGRTCCEAVNVAWQLRDVTAADGGFVCIPGSHKARYPVPPTVQSCEQTMGLVTHVDMKAGDVAVFMAAAQTHGAYPWRSEIPRRVVLMGYSSRSLG